MIKHIYNIAGNGKKYGSTKGVCRITGLKSEGVPFQKWVKPTFTDHAYLKPGTIISNEACFVFDEASEIVQKKTGREKLQRFRTYSHIIKDGEWYCLTKADKRQIFELICNNAEIVSLTDTGQKHLFFKYKLGFWQLDETYIVPDIEKLKQIHAIQQSMLVLGFSQTEVLTGNYQQHRIIKAGLAVWKEIEDRLKQFRGEPIFEFAGWMLFTND